MPLRATSNRRRSVAPADIEVYKQAEADPDSLPMSPYVSISNAHSPFDTYHRHHTPVFMWEANPHIWTAYRSQMDPLSCLQTLFSLHNETINVYTHLIGAVIMYYLRFVTQYGKVPLYLDRSNPTHVMATYLIDVFYAGCIFGLLASTFFHWFLCCSPGAYKMLARFDYSGISIIIATSFIPAIYMGFHCQHGYLMFYEVMIVTTASLVTLLPWNKTFSAPNFQTGRSLIYALLIAQCIVPLIHSAVIGMPGFPTVHLLILAEAVLCYGFGCFFYVTKFPERSYPGRFDLVGHSHQIFHVFVIAGMVVHHAIIVDFLPIFGAGCEWLEAI